MADLNSLLDLIPSANRTQPNFRAWASVLLQGMVDAANVAESLQTLFDVDNAIGDQLDKIGQWVGVSRHITEPLATTFFSWGVPGDGWGQGLWASPFEPPNSQVVVLDDSYYRILLKARIAANQWDGTIPGAYQAWNDLFGPEGFQILIQNVQATAPAPDAVAGSTTTGNMHILLALIGPPIDALTKALFTGSYLDLRSAGVAIDAYVTQTIPGRPLFAWGVGPAMLGDYTSPPVNLAGWGIGNWGDFGPAPEFQILPTPNFSTDTSAALEVRGSSLRSDAGAPLEFAAKPSASNTFVRIEAR